MRNKGLISLKAAGALDASKLPSRLKVLHWGRNPSRYGDIVVNDQTVRTLAANQTAAKFGHIAVDYMHCSVPDSTFYKGEPVQLAARSATPEVVPGEGLFITDIDWLCTAEEARNYRDLSACVKTDANGAVIFIHSVALARNGEIDGIVLPLSADPFANQDPASRRSPAEAETQKESMDFKLLLCALLGLAEAATDTEIETAAKSFAKKNDETVKTLTSKFEDALKPLTAKIEALEKGATGKTGAEAGTITAPVTAALADSTEYKALTAKVAALEVADIMRERAAIEAQAVRDGKVIPLSALPDKDGKGGMDNKSLKSLVAELPVTVPMDKRTPEGLKSLAAGTGATTADDQVRQTMGISKEAWDKHNSPSR